MYELLQNTGLLIITPKPGFRACTYIKPVNAKKWKIDILLMSCTGWNS